MSILVVGSVAFDTIKSLSGSVEKELGGAATYFGICASFFTDVRIVGVQSELLDTAVRSFKAGQLVDPVHRGRTICDGIAIKSPSARTFDYISRYADDMVTVSDADVAAALFVIL